MQPSSKSADADRLRARIEALEADKVEASIHCGRLTKEVASLRLLLANESVAHALGANDLCQGGVEAH